MIDATGGYISSSSLRLTQIQYKMRYDNHDGQRRKSRKASRREEHATGDTIPAPLV